MGQAIAIGGMALHAGMATSVVLAAHDGPSVLGRGPIAVPTSELQVVRADCGVTVRDAADRFEVDLVEHLFAAVGALQLEQGLRISAFGPEIPLLDGGSHRHAIALQTLAIKPAPRKWRITKSWSVCVGDATYEFDPGDDTMIEVSVQFDHPLVVHNGAQWNGDRTDFVDRVSKARTFGFFADAQRLRATARAHGANTRDVIVLCDDGSTLSDPPPRPDECALHKLLDLIGDLTLAAGVPLGRVRAHRPGHRATHAAVALAKQHEVMVRS